MSQHQLPTPEPQDILIVGASGDLTRRKLLPALYNLHLDGLLPPRIAIVGVGRTEMTDDAFREITRRINGGFNGLEDRRRFYAAACAVLEVIPPPSTGEAERGLPGTADEPEFERGNEAIRRHLQRRRAPRKKPAPRKAKGGSRKRTGTSRAKQVRRKKAKTKKR